MKRQHSAVTFDISTKILLSFISLAKNICKDIKMMNVFTIFKVKKLQFREQSIQQDPQINNEDSNRKGTLASSRQKLKTAVQ